MCGRYTITEKPQVLAQRFRADWLEAAYTPRYNAAPTQRLPVVVQSDDGTRRIELMRWGLIPSWAKDPAIGNRMINARAETLTQKPSFRGALKSRRCLVPADGFYEWQKVGSGKTPMRITAASKTVFAFAGLWDRWLDPKGEEIYSFTIVTVPAATSIRHIHDRMPLLLDAVSEQAWLDPNTTPDAIQSILRGSVDAQLGVHAVTTRVNSARIDDPSLIEPTDGPPSSG